MPSRYRTGHDAGVRSAAALVLALVTGCGGGGTEPIVVSVASVSLTTLSAAMTVGGSQQLSATARDAGGATLGARTISWSSSNSAVASLSGSSGATLTVTAIAVGSATITATSEGKTASVELTITAPVASVTVAPITATLRIGGTQQLTATSADAAGATLAGRVVTWSSAANAIASVSAAGLVTAVAAGTATITATSEGKSATSEIVVSSTPAASITGISPATLTSGTVATIDGSNFSPAAAENVVAIDGMTVNVTAASETQLTVQVGTLLCAPAHAARVSVTVGGLAAVGTQPVKAGALLSIAAGAAALLSRADAQCAELPAPAGNYLVSVVNMLQVPTAVTPFRFQARSSAATLVSPGGAGVSLSRIVQEPPARPARNAFARDELASIILAAVASDAVHERILESNRALLTRLRGARRALRRSSGGASRTLLPDGARLAEVPALNEVRSFRVKKFDTSLGGSSSCNDYTDIMARAVYVGSKSVIYEDTKAPLAGTMDSYFTSLGQEFDDMMYPVVSTYFGDPLASDQFTDQDGHLSMVFSPVIPSGVLGFVTVCDFFGRDATDNRSSNLGEFFYARVPTSSSSGFGTGTREGWLRTIRPTIVHEVKHIASVGARLVNDAPVLEESWLEEGTAMHAEELWLRNHAYLQPWKGNIGYRQSIYCDVRPQFAECTGAPYGIVDHFARMYEVLEAPGASSLFGRVADGDGNFYGSSWSFVRWAVDRHATTEAAFLRGLTQSTSLSGMNNVAAQTGRSATEMLASWTLSLYLDDSESFASNVDLQFPTWNTHDLYRGLNQDFPAAFTNVFPLLPTNVSASDFTEDNAGIHGGSFTMYLLAGSPSAARAVSLTGIMGGGPAPDALRVTIARLP
jgi:uncharacterized protein YjdB